MRLTQIEKMLEDHEKRIKELEGSVNTVVEEARVVEIISAKQQKELRKVSNFKNAPQDKKDKGEAQNVALSGDTKKEQGKTTKTEHMPGRSDNHPTEASKETEKRGER